MPSHGHFLAVKLGGCRHSIPIRRKLMSGHYVLPGGFLGGRVDVEFGRFELPAALVASIRCATVFLEALPLDPTPCHLDELEWQMKVAVVILNPTFLVFIQLVAT
jgi:hypothetical protein